MINDIDFARDSAGKYYIYSGYKVKVVGYYCSGVGACVIVPDYPRGRARGTPCVNNRFLVTVNKKTDKFYYVSMDDLKEIEG